MGVQKLDGAKLGSIIAELQQIVDKLQAAYPGRKFTLDGHIIGSIGEVWAANKFGLALKEHSFKGYDAVAPDGKPVEIKTARNSKQINFSATESDNLLAERLIVVKISPELEISTIYDGPALPVWEAANEDKKRGRRTISVNKVIELQRSLNNKDRQ